LSEDLRRELTALLGESKVVITPARNRRAITLLPDTEAVAEPAAVARATMASFAWSGWLC
jgi:hypothetical protein